jgi:hypothetical protein
MAKLTIQKKGKMYECQAFFPSGYPKKWKYVRDLQSFTQFLNKEHSSWKYFNVYEKGTKQYLKRFYPGNAVPKTLLLLLLGSTLLTHYSPVVKATPISIEQLNPMKNTTSNKLPLLNGFNNSTTIPTTQPLKKEGLC